jgi:hypothetical protein
MEGHSGVVTTGPPIDHGAAEAAVKIHNPRRLWAWLFPMAGMTFALAALELEAGYGWLAGFGLFLSCLVVLAPLRMRTVRVDLTPESAILHRVRRRSIPWSQVQAVIQNRHSEWYVQFILENGESVTLPAPMTVYGSSRIAYERDFHRIGQWWLAHRGPSWRPTRPEAPGQTA